VPGKPKPFGGNKRTLYTVATGRCSIWNRLIPLNGNRDKSIQAESGLVWAVVGSDNVLRYANTGKAITGFSTTNVNGSIILNRNNTNTLANN
jgi:hypothetical protein